MKIKILPRSLIALIWVGAPALGLSLLLGVASGQEGSPDPTPTVEATACTGVPYETVTWNSHAQFSNWKCDANGLNFDSTQGSYTKVKTDACGQDTTVTGSTHLEWGDVKTVSDDNGSHEEYKFVEVDSDGNQVGDTGWLTPTMCCVN